MMTHKSCYTLLVAAVTVLLVSSCRPDCHDCKNAPVSESSRMESSSEITWRTYKTGNFGSDSPFYSQFGAAPYDIATNPELPKSANSVQPGSKIRFTVYGADKASPIFTAYMEKKSGGKTPADNWLYSATGASGERIDTGNACFSCHQQQANNDFLFSLPVNKNP